MVIIIVSIIMESAAPPSLTIKNQSFSGSRLLNSASVKLAGQYLYCGLRCVDIEAGHQVKMI